MSYHLVINGWFWGRAETGSGQYLHGLLQHLPAAMPGWRISLLLPHTKAETCSIQIPAGVIASKVTTPIYAHGAQLRKLSWEQQIFPTWCRRLSADVAFVPYWGSPIRSVCATAVTIHDLIPLLLDDYASKTTARAYTWLVGQSARGADAVFTVSQSAGTDIVEYLGIPREKVHVTYEGLGYPHRPVTDPTEVERLRTTYRLPPCYLFYLGGFDPRKNVDLLIEAYARAKILQPEVPPLVIAGRLPDSLDPWLTDPRPAIANLQLQDHVHLLGFVPDADKPGLYSMADLFVFPSRYEGFGLPPLEAMTCGTPTLVARSSSLPEIVGDTLTPVPVNNIDALASGMLDALIHPPDPAQLIQQASRFSWETTAAATAALLTCLT